MAWAPGSPPAGKTGSCLPQDPVLLSDELSLLSSTNALQLTLADLQPLFLSVAATAKWPPSRLRGSRSGQDIDCDLSLSPGLGANRENMCRSQRAIFTLLQPEFLSRIFLHPYLQTNQWLAEVPQGHAA
jgi:hypothetical protein